MEKIARSLEDQFFLKKDAELKAKLLAMKKMKETKEALKEVSGIEDDIVLQKLVELNIRPEIVASLSIIPLIEVAWANGSVDEKEKEAVLAAVNKFSHSDRSIDHMLVERWLEHKPDPALLESWVHYMETICDRMDIDEIIRFKTEILAHAKIISEASGGVLGLGKISAKEKKVLEVIEQAFELKCNRKKA